MDMRQQILEGYSKISSERRTKALKEKFDEFQSMRDNKRSSNQRRTRICKRGILLRMTEGGELFWLYSSQFNYKLIFNYNTTWNVVDG